MENERRLDQAGTGDVTGSGGQPLREDSSYHSRPSDSRTRGDLEDIRDTARQTIEQSRLRANLETFTQQAPGSAHYRAKGAIEPIHLIESQQLPFHLANVVKYCCRWDLKDGLADLRKARWYLERFLQLQEQMAGHQARTGDRPVEAEADVYRGSSRS